MPHSTPTPQKILPPTQVFFRNSNFFLQNCRLGSPLMNIYGSSHGPSAVVYHALRNFCMWVQNLSLNNTYIAPWGLSPLIHCFLRGGGALPPRESTPSVVWLKELKGNYLKFLWKYIENSFAYVNAHIITKFYLGVNYYLMNLSLKFHEDRSICCGDICNVIMMFFNH